MTEPAENHTLSTDSQISGGISYPFPDSGNSHPLTTSPSKGMLGSDGMTYPVAFLHVSIAESSGSAVGGLLVSDNTGVPIEFVITNAIRPTPAQRVLYGKSLKRHISIELCGRQLLQYVKTKPSVIFVRDSFMLSLQSITEIPVLQLTVSEQLGSATPQPTLITPPNHPHNSDLIDIRSLDADMLDGFSRIEQCREILARSKEEYRI